MTERDKISLVKETIIDDLRTADIVNMFNEWCEENHYSEFCYPTEVINEQLSGYTPRKILLMAQGNDFKVTDTYFYITDLEELISFNYYDEEKSPIDIDELAKAIVENNSAYRNIDIQDLLDSFEDTEEEEE